MTEQKTHKRVNRFSGESVMLTREEAKKHDAIFYYEYMATEEDKKLGWAVLNYGTKFERILIGLDKKTQTPTWFY